MRSGLTVGVIGWFAVHRSGSVLEGSAVGSRKARLLLALLAVERGRLVSIERLVDALWGDASPRRQVRDSATVVSRLRAVFGADAVLSSGGGYRLGDGLGVDLYEAGGLVDEGERSGEAALSAALRAVELLERGDVLEDWPDAKWAEPARALHAGLLRRARHAVALAALEKGDLRRARAAAEMAVATDVFDEAACRLLMCACARAGEPAPALLAYERLRRALVGELGADASASTRELHVAILQGWPGAAGVTGGWPADRGAAPSLRSRLAGSAGSSA